MFKKGSLRPRIRDVVDASIIFFSAGCWGSRVKSDYYLRSIAKTAWSKATRFVLTTNQKHINMAKRTPFVGGNWKMNAVPKELLATMNSGAATWDIGKSLLRASFLLKKEKKCAHHLSMPLKPRDRPRFIVLTRDLCPSQMSSSLLARSTSSPPRPSSPPTSKSRPRTFTARPRAHTRAKPGLLIHVSLRARRFTTPLSNTDIYPVAAPTCLSRQGSNGPSSDTLSVAMSSERPTR